MDIRCERCGTEYEIDDSRVTDAGVSVKCSTCELVFTVRPGDGVPRAATFQIHRDGQPLATCPDIATAQRWVSERRLLRSDEMEREGRRTPLGEVPELLPFFALVEAARTTPPPVEAPRLTAPLFATNPSIPMPALEEPVRDDARATTPHPAPEDASLVKTTQLFLSDLSPAETATTRQYQVTTPETATEAATELALPALTIPAGAKPPAVTMQFRAITGAEPPDTARTETMLAAVGPLQPQGALPADVDAVETLQFKRPSGAFPAQHLVGAPLLSAPAGARSQPDDLTPPDGTPAVPAASQVLAPAPDKTPAMAQPAPEQLAPTARLPQVTPAPMTDPVDLDDDDPEILAFKNRGRGGRVALGVVAAVVVLAAVGWFVVKPMLDAPAPAAPPGPSERSPVPAQEEALVAPPTEAAAPEPAQANNAAPAAAKKAEAPAAKKPEPAPAKKPEPKATAKAEPVKQPAPTASKTTASKTTVSKTTTQAAPKPAPTPVIAPAPPEPGLFDDLPPPPPPSAVDVDALVAQGNHWLKRGQPAKAEDYFDQAVAERPGNAEAVYLRGVARFDLGRTDEAITDLQRALQISPRFAAAMIVLADAWKTKGNVAQARSWYQKYLDVAPDGSDAAAARANLARLK